jgi:hypothetical protein
MCLKCFQNTTSCAAGLKTACLSLKLSTGWDWKVILHEDYRVNDMVISWYLILKKTIKSLHL